MIHVFTSRVVTLLWLVTALIPIILDMKRATARINSQGARSASPRPTGDDGRR